MTSYDPAIPQAQDILSDSQSDLLDNFSGLSTYLNINHEDFTSANFGKHKFVTLTKQSDGLTTSSTEVGLFCKNDVQPTPNPQLYFRSSGSKAGSIAFQRTPMPSIFAFCIFDNAGTLIGQSYNVTNVIATVAGRDYTINFNHQLASQNFFPCITVFTATNPKAPTVRSTTTTSIRILLDTSISPGGNIQNCSVIIWGD